MEKLIQDIRYGLRVLRKNPGFALIGVLTLSLGIGVTTAMISVIDAVLLKPLPYKDPNQIVAIWERTPSGERNSVSSAEFIDWKNQNQAFDCIVALDGGMFNLSDKNQPEQVLGILGSASLFQVLGVNPSIGRGFLPEEEASGRDRVVVLSHGLWQRRFGSDPAILGKHIQLNDEEYTVIGVMPANFRFLSTRVELWMPLSLRTSQLNRQLHYLNVYGRLKPWLKLKDAQADMDLIARNLEKQYPESHVKNWGNMVLPLRDQIVTADLRQSLLIFLIAVGFVLLIACANVANLILARGATRLKEISVRAALGAGKLRLMRQLLTESVLLSLLGGVLGLFLSVWLVSLARTLIPAETFPSEAEVAVNLRVLLFTTGISMLTGILCGLAPSWSIAKPPLAEFLKEGSRTTSMSFHRSRFRNIMVVSEVTLATMLHVGAGLLIRSLILLQRVDPGFTPDNVLTLQLTLPENKYSDPGKIINFYGQVIDRIKALPKIQQAALVTEPPLAGSGFWVFFTIDGRPVESVSQQPTTNLQIASPGYFETMSIQLLRGRDFNKYDTLGKNHFAVINETLAQKFFSNEDPIGKRLRIESRVPGQRILGPATPWEIVGVVRNVKIQRLGEGVENCEVYLPHSQSPWTSMCLVVRVASDPVSLVNSIKAAVFEIDKTQPVTNIRTMEQVVAESLSQPRFRTQILGLFSAMALLLAAVGIYGVISYAVAQRTQEIGLRMALGANQRDMVLFVVRQGMMLCSLGLIIGGLASLLVSRALSSFLFGVGAADPVSFLTTSAILMTVAFLASYIPARRAASVDPMVALRYE